jgi:tetratricopeptide (TPR) repeat protein
MSDVAPAGEPVNVVRDGVAGAFVQARSIAGGVHVHPVRSEQPVPRQLLAAPRHFVGRDAELARLTADLDSSAGGTLVISALTGAGGIGKTALALHWAHRNLDRFPDGQLFVDLQGFSPAGEPVDPAVAVRGFLSALGVDPGQIPVDLPAQAALYRSLVAGRRLLIVLDNAADVTQVMPLLPGSPSCTVLVTSRRSLTGLVTRQSAHFLPIGVLTDTEARELLTTRIGVERTSAEADAVTELVACCGGFALALDIVAGRAAMNPVIPLAELAAELGDVATRLGALDDDEPAASLPAVLSWSLHALTEEQTTAFALLGIAPGPDISLPAAANLMGVDPVRARRVLRTLAEASLVTADARGRYSMHDLIRGYATHTADRLNRTVRVAALQRVMDFSLHTAYAADRLYYPHRWAIQLAPPMAGTIPQALSDASAALAWFNDEHANLLAAQQVAAQHGWHQVVWQLAWTLVKFHAHQGLHEHRLATWRVALTAVEHLPDPAARILIHRNLGRAYAEARRHDEGIRHLHEALALAEHHANLHEQAYVHANLAWVWAFRDDFRTAMAHGERGLHLRRALGDTVGEANALNVVSRCAALLGDHDRAREHSEAALTLHREQHHRHGEAAALATLGYVSQQTGHHHRAVQYYEQAITLFRGIDNTHDGASTANRLGLSYAALGDHDQARMAWQEALGLFQRQGRPDMADIVQQRLIDLDEQQGLRGDGHG